MNMFKTFTDAYTSVPESVRKKLCDLFNTWKAQSPMTGATLFPNDPLKKIDNFIMLARAKQAEQTYQEQRRKQSELQQQLKQFMTTGPLPQSALVTEIDKLIALTNQRKTLDPSDVDAQAQLAILTQLKNVITTQTLPSNILPSIQQQLVTFSHKEMQRLSSMPVQNFRPVQSPNHNSSIFQSVDLSKIGQVVQSNPQIAQPVPKPPYSVATGLPANFLNSLKSSGLLNLNNGNSNPGAPNIIPSQQYGGSSQLPTPQRSLTERILNSLNSQELLQKDKSRPTTPVSIHVELNSASLQRPRLELIDRLYKDMPLQCGSCGRRFTNQKEKSAHLDWHFRVNKRSLEENRIQSRAWYLSAQRWIDSANIDQHDTDGSTGNFENTKVKSKPIDVETLSKLKVHVPTSEHLLNLPCPICQEKFKSVWDSEEEEWVWKNALEVKGRIFHATCHAESERSGDLVKRILAQDRAKASTPLPNPSRERTPIQNATPNIPVDLASILASVNAKRKGEPMDDSAERSPKREKV